MTGTSSLNLRTWKQEQFALCVFSGKTSFCDEATKVFVRGRISAFFVAQSFPAGALFLVGCHFYNRRFASPDSESV
jgi:hypothetical protein